MVCASVTSVPSEAKRPLSITLVGCLLAATAAKGVEVDYATQIKPILATKCYSCHGALKRQSGLRLETRSLMLRGGDSGRILVPGNSRASRLVERITADESERMPPRGEGSGLTREEVNLIRDWIDQGAKAPREKTPPDPRQHWAFRPLIRPNLPDYENVGWVENPIDAFIAADHARHQLTPQIDAPRLLLLRRLCLDLIGLPPTPEQIAACESDVSPDWYRRTVNALLEDPRHGERWARHWMDIWRYSDWWGYAGQLRYSQKHIWHWRDWIVESLNAGLPYDEMVRLMLAADESHPNNLDKLRATGYLARNYFLFNRNQWLDEVVEHTSKGFLGLTMNCAKCHDHKYDPIAQTDYYAMRAFFEPYHVRVDVMPDEPNLEVNGIPRAFDGPTDVPTYLFLGGRENDPDKSEVIAPSVPSWLMTKELEIQPVRLPLTAWQPQRRPWVIDAHLHAAQREVHAAKQNLASIRQQFRRRSAAQAAKHDEPAAELKVAERALQAARAKLTGVEQRATATRAAWRNEDGQDGTQVDQLALQSLSRAALTAERKAQTAEAAHALAVVELELLRAPADKRDSLKDQLKSARQSLDKARQQTNQPPQPNDQFSPFVGARWTPTRFLTSVKDDPAVSPDRHSSGRRTALANWITAPSNPLTARVAVNHIWARHFGAPLAATVFDLGRNGTPPTHPELLDWLAAELVHSGWNMKQLHRLIVTSATYRMSSSVAGAENNVDRDPDNLRYWRRAPIRLESQVIRDSILAHAGTLDLACGGAPVKPQDQATSRRRSLYFFHSNDDRNPFLCAFDEAMVKECYQRNQSIVPQQALAMTNSGLVLDACPQIVERLMTSPTILKLGQDDELKFIRAAFRVLLGITPSEAEVAACRQALESWRKLPSQHSPQSSFIWTLINHDDFVTLR